MILNERRGYQCVICVRFRVFTQLESVTGGEKRARLTLLVRQCVESLIRSLIVKTFGSQASEFEANHRYSTDAIVCKAVADTPPQASIQTKLDIPIFLWLTKSASARFT